VQLKWWGIGIAFAIVGCAGLAPAVRADASDDDDNGGALLRYFNDSNHILVRSMMGDYTFTLPKSAALAVHWNNERVTIPAVSAPPGSPEAVDAITTASRPISGNAYQDFIKVRNEVTGEMTKGNGAFNYYVSMESDYLAQQVGAHYAKDLNDAKLNLSMGTSYGWDRIDPLPDDDTRTSPASKTTLHWNAEATQVLSPVTMLRVGVEYNLVEGLQHNPYRNVYAGGTIVPENQPDERQRRDVFVRVNQYLQNRSSLKFSYRLYNDDWGITSHELGARLSQYITPGTYVRYQYRYYTQTAADFYRAEYLTTNGIDGYLTGDYRMAALSSHLFGVAVHFDLGTLAADTRWLRPLGLWANYERYFNSNNYSADILETGVGLHF
jgi:hypothetical protein